MRVTPSKVNAHSPQRIRGTERDTAGASPTILPYVLTQYFGLDGYMVNVLGVLEKDAARFKVTLTRTLHPWCRYRGQESGKLMVIRVVATSRSSERYRRALSDSVLAPDLNVGIFETYCLHMLLRSSRIIRAYRLD